MTSTDMQLSDPLDSFQYVKCNVPWLAGYESAQDSVLQIIRSMLTAPAHEPGSQCHNAHINEVLEQPAVKQAVEAVVTRGS